MPDRLRRLDGPESAPPRVLVVGGGVAALETVLALRANAGMRVEVELIAPHRELRYPPLDVVEPFGLAPPRLALADALAPLGVRHRLDAVADVDALGHWVRTAEGAVLRYEALVLAVGARPVRPLAGALVFGDPRSREEFARLLAGAEVGRVERLLFAVPAGVRWPLPLYELAVMTARRLQGRARVSLATTERAPLELFGGRASGRLLEYLERLGIAFLPAARLVRARPGEALLEPGSRVVRADRVVTLPLLRGPAIVGVPRDADGFVPVDAHGAVRGVADLYAAGDATDYPIKQGGLATQQADAIAEAIAARAGAPLTPAPFRPVLRGMLVTSEQPQYLEADVAGGSGSRTADVPLWWPPLKVAGRHLAPFLTERFGARLPTMEPDERWLEGAIPCEITLPVPEPTSAPAVRAS
ncbi:MAG: FAD-dependent oxidoreductase [Actinobacteria bacterium]|nr:FAD-dependent oxidoreductase [Actinomycetota bacterium]